MSVTESKLVFWLLATAALSGADMSFANEMRLSGFGSVRAGKIISSADNPNFNQLYDDDGLSFADESLFALQVDYALSERLSATVQWVAKGAEQFDPVTHWAFIKYQWQPDWHVKVGRMSNPLFHQSDYNYVGYAHNYSRLPKSVYFGFDFETLDGIAIDGRHSFGAWALHGQALYGNWQGDIFQASVNRSFFSKLNHIRALNLELSNQWLQLFTGRFIADVDFGEIDELLVKPTLAPVLVASSASATEKQRFLAAMLYSGHGGSYQYVGAAANHGPWLFETEFAHYGVKDSVDGFNNTGYLAIGYRFDEVIVTAHHERFTQQQNGLGFLDGVSDPLLLSTGLKLKQQLGSREMKMNVLSLRYDFHPSAAFKADAFFGDDQRSNVGRFRGFSFGVDFVF